MTTNNSKVATDDEIRGIVSYLKIYETQLSYERGRWPIWSITDIHDVRTVIARIESQEKEIARLKRLCTKADGMLGLWLHRYLSTTPPDDLQGDISQTIGELRKASKGEPL